MSGGVTVHFILCIYVMLMIGIVVDEYFVPSLEVIAQVLNMSPDVAGATVSFISPSLSLIKAKKTKKLTFE